MRTACCLVLLSAAAHASSLTQVSDFGANPGALLMYEYVPGDLPAGSPLVVVMHGCSQSAAVMESAGWNELADLHHFAVVYPQQQSANNPAECFNWAGEDGDLADIERGMGENRSVMSMIDTAIAAHHLDTHRVYVTGLSAGAAFTSVMLATWPDRFAAGAVMSGVAYRCATTVATAYSCLNPGVTKTAAEWGDLVRGADAFTGPRPRVQLWHGAADTTVMPMNEGELVKQWTNVLGAPEMPALTETIGEATHTTYEANGAVAVDVYKVANMKHAIAIGGPGCPATPAAFFEDHGICSTTLAAQFFGLVDGTGTGSGSGSGGEHGGDGHAGCSAAGGAGWPLALALVAVRRGRRRGPARRT